MFVDGESLKLELNGRPAKRKEVYENAVEAATRGCKFTAPGLSHRELKTMIREGEIPPLDKMVGRNESEVANKFSLYVHLEMRRGAACYYCGATRQGGSSLERDHVVPKARGGSDKEPNIVNACRSCNQNKSSQLLEAFRERIITTHDAKQPRFFGELPEVRRALKISTQTKKAIHPELCPADEQPLTRHEPE